MEAVPVPTKEDELKQLQQDFSNACGQIGIRTYEMSILEGEITDLKTKARNISTQAGKIQKELMKEKAEQLKVEEPVNG